VKTTEPASAVSNHSNAALWVTVIVEALMIIAIGSYQIYEIRRQSRALAEFSAGQGEKIDRMISTLELYLGKKLEEPGGTNILTSERLDKVIGGLQKLSRSRTNGAATQPGAVP
jgi:hypothetical protein